jgi:hypothetical protein
MSKTISLNSKIEENNLEFPSHTHKKKKKKKKKKKNQTISVFA